MPFKPVTLIPKSAFNSNSSPLFAPSTPVFSPETVDVESFESPSLKNRKVFTPFKPPSFNSASSATRESLKDQVNRLEKRLLHLKQAVMYSKPDQVDGMMVLDDEDSVEAEAESELENLCEK